MRALLQKVTHASVVIEGKVVGQIGQGILALIGIEKRDDESDLVYIAKVLKDCRLFQDASGAHWKANLKTNTELQLLLVSQFTLHAVTRKPKPDFHRAMGPEPAKVMFDKLVATMRKELGEARVSTGVFGAMMSVELCNDGPVTVMADSRNKEDEYPGEEEDASATPFSPLAGGTPKSAGGATAGEGKATGEQKRKHPSKSAAAAAAAGAGAGAAAAAGASEAAAAGASEAAGSSAPSDEVTTAAPESAASITSSLQPLSVESTGQPLAGPTGQLKGEHEE